MRKSGVQLIAVTADGSMKSVMDFRSFTKEMPDLSAVSLMALRIYGHIIANYSSAFALINKRGAKGPNGAH